MNSQTEKPNTLADKCIWIIDDDIPIQAADFEKDDMASGDRPIDRGTLLSLINKKEYWTDDAVLDLCKELIKEAGEIKGFILPTGAITYLKKGAEAPDVIIFDMNYQNIQKEKTFEYLETILKGYISIIQIYTKEGIETILPDLDPLTKKYSHRLQAPLPKGNTNAEQLNMIISQKLISSLSAHLASDIRTHSTIAIEDVLVRIDDLPLNTALKLLAGEDDQPTNDVELIELISTKVSNHLKTSQEIENIVKDYAKKLGVPTGKEKQFITEVVDLLAASVRSHIEYENKLITDIQTAKESLVCKKVDDAETAQIIKDFFAFRVYDHPCDEIVRTGDIISMGEQRGSDYPDLYLILTPGCDLFHFWQKTRGILTFAKMHPLTKGKGIDQIISHGTKEYAKNSSITAKSPFIFPSVFINKLTPMDYGLFFHEIEHIKLDVSPKIDKMTPEQKNALYKSQLTYPILEEQIKGITRECRLSEPFLSGVLSEISSLMFRTGVPDFPDEEKNRLKNSIKI